VWNCAILQRDSSDTGGETKLNLTKPGPATKTAQVDHTINAASVAIFSVQLCLVLLLGVLGASWVGHGNFGVWYLRWDGSAGPIAGEQWAAFDYESTFSPGMMWNGTGTGPRPSAPSSFVEIQRQILQREADRAADAVLMQQISATHLSNVLASSDNDVKMPLPIQQVDLAVKAHIGLPDSKSEDHKSRSLIRGLKGQQQTSTAENSSGGPFLWFTALVLPLRFLLLSSMMIPISLRVTLDALKWWYASQVRVPEIEPLGLLSIRLSKCSEHVS
jgi:hypothetical protein